jgi:excisionase family DNA binding protein
MSQTALTTTEAAQRLGVTRRRVLQLCKRGELRAKRFGRAWAIHPFDLSVYQRKMKGGDEKE